MLESFVDLITFDYLSFIDELAVNNMTMINNLIEKASKRREWDVVKLAEKLFEKSIIEGDHATYARLGLSINDVIRSTCSMSFEDILRNIALRALNKELQHDNVVRHSSDKPATATAEFLSELYKIDWITNDDFFRCMELVASTNFETIRRIKILRSLIKPSVLKLMAIRVDDRFIFYTQQIRARSNTMTDSRSHLLCLELLEILETIAAMTNVASALPEFENAEKPNLGKISLAMGNIDFNDVDDCVMKINKMNIGTVEELKCLADIIVNRAVSNSDHVLNYAKLAAKFGDLSVQGKNGTTSSFKLVLINRCQHTFIDSFERGIDPSQVPGAYCLVHFISELYNLKMMTQEFIQLCMDMFFHTDSNCMNTVVCINLMMRTIGAKLEAHNITIMNNYFSFFEFVVGKKENSYRSVVYEKLIELRRNKWTVPADLPKPVLSNSLVIDIESLDDRLTRKNVAVDLRKHLTTSARIKKFVSVLLSRSFNDPKLISSCAKLFKELADVSATEPGCEITFNEILTETLNFEFVFSNSKRTLDDNTRNSVASLIVLVGELYQQDIFADADLHSWILHKHINQVPLHHLTYFSSVIAPKIQAQGNPMLKTIFGLLETTIHEATIEMCFEIKNDLTELSNTLKYSNDFKLNNPHHSDSRLNANF